MVEITRDVQVNGESFVARTTIDRVLLRYGSEAVRAGIEDDLDASLRILCKQRFGAGSLIRLDADRYEWVGLSASAPLPGAGGQELVSSH